MEWRKIVHLFSINTKTGVANFSGNEKFLRNYSGKDRRRESSSNSPV